jgi:hypothetical protein
MRTSYWKSVGLRWLGALTAFVGFVSLALIQYASESDPLGRAVLNNSFGLVIFAGLLVASLYVLIRRGGLLRWVSYLIGFVAAPLIGGGLSAVLEGPALGLSVGVLALVVGFTPLPGVGSTTRENGPKEISAG